MFCTNCGARNEDTARFCYACGNRLSQPRGEAPAQQAASEAPVASVMPDKQSASAEAYEVLTAPAAEETAEPALDPAAERQRNRLARSILKKGILSMCFALSVILFLVGFILSCVTKGKARKYRLLYGTGDRRVTTGRRMANVGFIIGLIFTIPMVCGAIAGICIAIFG